MRFTTRDGVPLEGETATDIIDELRACSHTPGRDRTHFLALLARGANIQTGAHIRSTDCESTLADLLAAGLIERIN